MATISSAGLGSGLDVNSIVSQLMALERAPLQQVQQRVAAVQTRLSAVGTLRSQLATLQDAASALSTPAQWSRTTAASGNPAAFSATVTGDSAMAGTHRIQVKQLASTQTVASAALTPGVSVGTGRMVIQMGQWSDGTGGFTASGMPISIDISSGNNTPEGIAAAINASGAGVRASLLTDATGSRLVISSISTGVANGFQVSLDEDVPSTGLDGLVFTGASAGTGMQRTSVAANAKVSIDGIEAQSPTQRFDGLLPGVQLNVMQVTPSDSTLSLSADREAQRKAITDFVAAYNAVAATLATATGYNEASKTGGTLQGDSAILSVQSALREVVRGTRAGGGFERLADAGLSLDRSGKLAIDEKKLTAALDRGQDLGQLLHGSGTAGSTDGLALRMRALAKTLTGDEGAVTLKATALTSQQKRLSTDTDRINSRLTQVEARLRRQYSQLDSSMASLNQLNTYVGQQIAQWNKSNS